MKLLLVSVLFAVASLAAGQLPTAFQYNQQFGRGIVAAPSVASFEPNRTFRLKQVPVQQSVFFPVQPEVAAAVAPTPAIVAPIPVAIANPIPVAPPATVAIENTPAVAPATSHNTRRVVKKVRVVQEKPVQVADAVIFPDTPEPRALNNEQTQVTPEEEKLLREAEEAKNAHYSFSSSSQDSIYDNAISRSETRDGLALTGMYSYSDGFFKRTVHYQADQDGYRVVK